MKSYKLTTRFQVTIPKEIREALNLKAGDSLSVRALESGYIIINKEYPDKEYPVDKEYYQAITPLVTGWDSPEDDEAFAHLQHL